ncbi:MAG: DUF86 domain-containing protein [Alphaproteobacteria bacterium]
MPADQDRDLAALLDAAEAARDALEFVGDMDRATFLRDRKTQAAVQHKLLVIGEAVKRVSSSTRDRDPKIAWRAIAGTRDRLIHGYDSVDLDAVWLMVERDLPRFLVQVETLLPPRP